MIDKDEKRCEEHFRSMVQIVSKELADCKVSETTTRWEIEVSKSSKRRSPYVKLMPEDEFMEDENDAFETILREGIRLAKDILDRPPMPDRKYQGDVVLSHQGVRFSKKGGGGRR